MVRAVRSTSAAHLGLAFILSMIVSPVAAHGVAEEGVAAARWTLDPWIVTPLALTMLLYSVGLVRLTVRATGLNASRAWHAAAYGAGWLALFGALLSPLHWLGEHLFTFHMIEHEIVMAVAAPLLVLARPAGVLLWGVPRRWRIAIGAASHARNVQAIWRWATRPRHATVLHGLAIWLWHIPPIFDAAVASSGWHRLQHLSFFVTALVFWWSMLRRSSPGGAVWHLFVTMTHTSILGALMALAPKVLYHLQTAAAPAFGMTPLEDQQLAGVIMWVPAETVYAGAALTLAALWIRRSGAGSRDGAPSGTPNHRVA
jgi:putative membrane protein